jgi:hypothetical protein
MNQNVIRVFPPSIRSANPAMCSGFEVKTRRIAAEDVEALLLIAFV